MNEPIEAQLRHSGSWKPAELVEAADGALVVVLAGENEPLGPADVFAIRTSENTARGVVEAARAAGFEVVEAED